MEFIRYLSAPVSFKRLLGSRLPEELFKSNYPEREDTAHHRCRQQSPGWSKQQPPGRATDTAAKGPSTEPGKP